MKDMWHLASLWTVSDLSEIGGTWLCTTTDDGAIVKTIVSCNDDYSRSFPDDPVEQPKWICLEVDPEAVRELHQITSVGDVLEGGFTDFRYDVEDHGKLDVAIGAPKWFRLAHVGTAIRGMLTIAKRAIVLAPFDALTDPENASTLAEVGLPDVYLIEGSGAMAAMAWLRFPSKGAHWKDEATIKILRRQ